MIAVKPGSEKLGDPAGGERFRSPVRNYAPKTLISHWRRWCRLMELQPITIVGWEAAKLGQVSPAVRSQRVGP